MKKNDVMPTILGLKPPTKEVLILKTEKPVRGYSCMIFHADVAPNAKSGEHIEWTSEKLKRKGLSSWLHFKDADTMRRFGKLLIDAAERCGN